MMVAPPARLEVATIRLVPQPAQLCRYGLRFLAGYKDSHSSSSRGSSSEWSNVSPQRQQYLMSSSGNSCGISASQHEHTRKRLYVTRFLICAHPVTGSIAGFNTLRLLEQVEHADLPLVLLWPRLRFRLPPYPQGAASQPASVNLFPAPSAAFQAMLMYRNQQLLRPRFLIHLAAPFCVVSRAHPRPVMGRGMDWIRD